MKIKLAKQKRIIVRAEETIETDEIEIERIVYLPRQGVLRIVPRGRLAAIDVPVAEDSALVKALGAAAADALKAKIK